MVDAVQVEPQLARRRMHTSSKENASPLPASTDLIVRGMTCQNCARHVVDALQGLPEVASAGVSFEHGRATIRWRPHTPPNVPAAIEAVAREGYTAQPVAPGNESVNPSRWSPLAGWRFNVVVGTLIFIPLVLGEWVFHLEMQRWFQILSFVLATLVQIFCGARFYRGAWNQLRQRSANMDTLVALGSTTAYAFSAWGLFTRYHGHLYFMEAVGIIALISVGHWIEARVSSRAASALEKLLRLAPQTARIRDGGGEREIPVAQLKTGDRIILKPGDIIPTDGEIVEGASTLDESMLTGEAVPVDKNPGDKTFAGTKNINGHLVVRVTAIGEATALAGIIAAVQRAQTSRADIQRLGDRVSNVFVPIILVITVATALWWGFAYTTAKDINESLSPFLWMPHLPDTALAAAFIHAAAVLIVACPCAMGLATPIAIMAGTNAAASRGILIRDGIALEKAGAISAVVFDKTGTLTRGQPAVTAHEIIASNSGDPEYPIKLAAALARRSTHPLSQSVARLSPEEFALTNWQEIRGSGVQAQFQPNRMSLKFSQARLGSLRWMANLGLGIEGPAFVNEWMSQGATILGLAVDQQLIALFALQDTLKDHSPDVVRELKAKGLDSYLITGDNRRTAETIAHQVGIPQENVFAEIRPEEKAKIVAQLQQRGQRIAFVGDGINDAPALEQADLGIAVAKASDVANEAADIILLKSEIEAIPETIGLAQATLRTIKQNLFWAFFYNAAGVPLAAMGFLSPILCAAAMGLSDLVVIGNALRLRRWRAR